ncbi:MAG TPA: hypothetical protein VMU80_06710 [Bryobacteraceae bacterium]|nr:hypothetical protein [Bryobacteraceae bacterium]
MFQASGHFTEPPVSGTDLFRLQGEPFSISVTASSAAVPVKDGQTWAVYSPLHMVGTVTSGLLQGPTTIDSWSTSIELSYNASGEPFTLATPLKIIDLNVTIQANIMMPAGTMSTLLVHPFTAPVTLTPANATLTYTDGSETTVLGMSGTLTTSVQNSSTLMLHNSAATSITVHPDGSQTVRPLKAGPVDLGAADDNTMLRFYASGVKGADGVQIRIAGQEVPVLYHGASDNFPGLDEVTVQVPRSLAGSGRVGVELTASGQAAAPLYINIQ